jgi:hypothetical protein
VKAGVIKTAVTCLNPQDNLTNDFHAVLVVCSTIIQEKNE